MKRLLTISAICISLFAYAQKPQFTPKPHPRIGVKNDIPAGPFAIIDLDQDGDKDLIVDTQYDNLKLYLNQGNGDFKEIPTPCAFQVAIIQMAVVDLQNDGDDDLLLSRHDKAFMVLENKGNFNFELRADTSVAPQKSYVFHAGDLNGDQYPDIAVSGNDSQNISELKIFLSDSLGSFHEVPGNSAYQGIAVNGQIAFGDLDDDGDTDMFMSGESNWPNQFYQNFSCVYWNNGNTIFNKDTTGFMQLKNSIIGIEDLNNDGKKDLVFTGERFTPSHETWSFVYHQTANGLSLVDTFPGIETKLADDHSIYFKDYNSDGFTDFFICSNSNNYGYSFWVENQSNQSYNILQGENFYGVLNNETVASADFNLDGRVDYITTMHGRRTQVILKDANNQPQITQNHFDPGFYRQFTKGDINGDSLIDFVVLRTRHSSNSSTLSPKIFINDGQGNFDEFSDADLPLYTEEIELIDADGDGDDDLIIGGMYGSSDFGLKLFTNNGAGDFTYHNTVDSTFTRGQVAIGDLDLDGDLDILVAGRNLYGSVPNYAAIYLNNGTGDFIRSNSSLPNVGAPSGGDAIHLFDYNQDGYLDAILPLAYKTVIYLNDSSGNLYLDSLTSLNYNRMKFKQLKGGDINKDGLNDFLAITDTLRGFNRIKLRVFYGNVNGGYTYSPPMLHRNNIAMESINLMDLDGDSLPDIFGRGGYFSSTDFLIYWNDTVNGFWRDSTFIIEDHSDIQTFGDDIDSDGDIDIVAASLNSNDQMSLGEVWVNETCPYYTYTQQLTACRRYYWPIANCTFTASGSYSVEVLNGNCKEAHILDLTINPQPSISLIQDSILQSDSLAPSYQWFSCDSSGTKTMISGANARTFTPQHGGYYAVANLNADCNDTSECFLYQGLSQREHHSIQFDAFPNPVEDKLIVNGLKEGQDLKLIGCDGKLILNQPIHKDKVQLDLSHLYPGVYYLVLNDPELGVSSQCIVKK